MKSISRETLQSATVEQLKVWHGRLNEQVAKGAISFKNSKGELVICPWGVFNASGAVVANREDGPEAERLWDLGTRVQIRCEAEKRNCGNIIAAFKSTLQAKTNTLTASVRTKGLPKAKCPVIDQLAEAETVLGNQQRVASELFMRTEQERQKEAIQAEQDAMSSIGVEQRAVAAQLKEADEAAKAERAAKAGKGKTVKDAKTEVPAPVEQPVAA